MICYAWFFESLSRDGRSFPQRKRPVVLRLRADIEDTKLAIETARNHFEQEVDPTLIDCCIYEWNAAQLRYQFLLRKFKSWES